MPIDAQGRHQLRHHHRVEGEAWLLTAKVKVGRECVDAVVEALRPLPCGPSCAADAGSVPVKPVPCRKSKPTGQFRIDQCCDHASSSSFQMHDVRRMSAAKWATVMHEATR